LVQDIRKQEYYYGTGKRKTSIAQVRLYQGQGNVITVNDQPMEEYFNWFFWQKTIKGPFELTDNLGKFHTVVKVFGGGISSQSEAIRHGIARALVKYSDGNKSVLRKHCFLTRDARIKESKKYGLKRARRAPQYTKR
jgi:small subunit ribosomal protein S9